MKRGKGFTQRRNNNQRKNNNNKETNNGVLENKVVNNTVNDLVDNTGNDRVNNLVNEDINDEINDEINNEINDTDDLTDEAADEEIDEVGINIATNTATNTAINTTDKKKKRSIYYHSHFLNYYTGSSIGTGGIDVDKLLDPLSTVIRLALLRYMDTGTKVSVSNNKIIFNRPNVWLLENVLNIQGITRGLYGYNREDLKLLYPPIFRTINWYIDDEVISDNIKKVLIIAKKGIKILTGLYQSSDGRTESYLMYCKDKIDEFINNDGIVYDELDEKIMLDEKVKSKLYETNKLLWSDREIQIITEKLTDIEDHYVKHKTIDCSAIKKYISMINKILVDKDQEFKKIIAYNDINNIIGDN